LRDPRIVFTGLVTEERARIELLRPSEAFFLPSVTEGLSLALLEAMACGSARSRATWGATETRCGERESCSTP
jgi:glycosyltransferase involved in cell wall biosynthesis